MSILIRTNPTRADYARAGLAMAIAILFATCLYAIEAPKPPDTRLAALGLPTGAGADWQQWDSFLTNAVKKLAQELRPEQQEQVGDVFLDSRYQLAQLLGAGTSDPVPQLFASTWDRLSPILKQSVPGMSQQSASQVTGFAAAMDGLKSLSGFGRQLGFFRITPDTLRGAARLLGTGDVDPLAYNLDLDSSLRNLLGFGGLLPEPRPSSLLEQGRLQQLRNRASAAVKSLLPRPAHAAEADVDRLNEWVPETQEAKEVQDYLLEVQKMLVETSDRVLAKSPLAPAQQQLYRQILFTTGWQESCWRQFVKKGAKLAPLASATGDVGIMQVNRLTWRSLYDIKGLTGDIRYNGNAGAEILHHYLTRYALRKKENEQPNGNLARATYSAYNGGPGALGRYRGVRQSPTWKKVDEAFWEKFQAVSSGQELAVKSCYG
ncbi:MAG TPA: lytic transglycosylase domain-containing protein [Candidatus Limnocylindrales bacterium]|nr:lytic transglycosylase domain-containing protein [Candidatus Limnocylindrales bacterium]